MSGLVSFARRSAGAAARWLRLRGRETGQAGFDLSPMRAYGTLAHRAGIDKLYLFLSFDCDTDEDVVAVRELDPWLHDLGFARTYAVPGVQLERGAETYRETAERGAEFINHGSLPHAQMTDQGYVSATFYNEMSPDAVRQDIEAGDRIVTEVIGHPPVGFRAPHFGSFQQPEQLGLIYETARQLGYTYCSTTLPSVALERGPVFPCGIDGQMHEIPTFGSVRSPLTLLDSWTYLTDRRDYLLSDEYHELFAETVETMLRERIPGLLSYYVDPAHVMGQPPFTRSIELLAERGVPSLRGTDVVSMHVGRQ